jgi:hypothetical protein
MKQPINEEFRRMQKLAGIQLNEIKVTNPLSDIKVDIKDDYVTISSDSGEYGSFIEDDGTVAFSVVYEDEDDRDGMDFDENNWEDILGSDHLFVKIKNLIPTIVDAADDYVYILVKIDDLVKIPKKQIKK